MKKDRAWFQAALVLILGGAVLGSTLAISRQDYSFFDPLIDIKSIISKRYVTEPDERAMQLAAINGMIESLSDPYTMYVPPSDAREFAKDLTGDFVGIGVQVVTRDSWLTVVTPLEDTPAYRAGVMAGDKIVEIDGVSTLGKTSDECVAMLSGDAGTKVSFVVDREGQKVPFTITRERVVATTVKGFHWEAKAGKGGNGEEGQAGGWQYFVDPARKIAYVRLSQFTPTSAAEVESKLKALGAESGGVGGLILDLRWNPGGVLQDATEIADLFLEEGTIVSTKGRAIAESVTRAKKEGTLPDFPVAVLINGGSASASEVLSGALVENNRAIAVGTRSFGKGLVQAVLSLPSGNGQLKITEQRYYLPSGRCIQRSDESAEWGVDPTPGFYVPMSDEEIAALVSVRRQEDVIGGDRHGGAQDRWSDPEWIVDRLKDLQLAAALKAVQGKIDTGEWKPTGRPLPESSTLAGRDLERAQQLRDRMERELVKLERRIASLERAAPEGEKAEPDLWPDSVDVTGGTVDVFDKDGKLVAKLRISGPDLEQWLIDAEVKKAEVGGGGGK